MKYLRKLYAKKRIKGYLLEIWTEEAEDAKNYDQDHYEFCVKEIESIRNENNYERLVLKFEEVIDNVYQRGYEAVREVLSVLIER